MAARPPKKKPAKNAAALNAASRIAREVLGIATLESRKMDDLDFHDLAAWSIEDALLAAFEAGRKDRASTEQRRKS